MATPGSPGGIKADLKFPMPPPLLHTRSGNEYVRPSTPTSNDFITPYATPQGSPSKNKLPPGAKELPNIFENAMRLEPSSPTKGNRNQLGLGSPNKTGRQNIEDNTAGSVPTPGSPLKKSGKENAHPNGRLVKEGPLTPTTPTNHAAFSRHELYQSRDNVEPSSRSRYEQIRGLSAEDLEKLNLPKVKRLANVTQICMETSSHPLNGLDAKLHARLLGLLL